MANCESCDTLIPPERLEVIPDARTCVNCSTTKATIGFMIPTAAKGCAPTLMVIPDDPEARRQATRANLRQR